MRILTGGEMRELDRLAIQEYGVPSAALMENAGAAVARAALARPHHRILVFAGKGNNAGDGFVAARHLLAYAPGIDVKVVLADPEAIFTGDAASNLEILRRDGVWDKITVGAAACSRLTVTTSSGPWEPAGPWGSAGPDLIIDAILGTGLSGAPHGAMAEAIELLNSIAAAHGCPVLAVDVPSGLDADTGAVPGPCVRAAETVTFAHLKRGLVAHPGADYAGRILVAGIGFPPALVGFGAPGVHLLASDGAARLLPSRPTSGHKGIFGHVLSIAGSAEYTGAAWLCAAAALRAGAGLSTLASVPEVLAARGLFPEVIARPMPSADVDLSPYNVVALGPGLGTGAEARRLVLGILAEALPSAATAVPAVVDADALNNVSLSGGTAFLRGVSSSHRLVITPHPGELARLLGVPTATIQSDRIGHALAAASQSESVVCLKGAHTVVASPEGAARIIPFGNPGMATGGAGDVLTGVIAGLLANGLEPYDAASLGAFIHAAAGDLAAAEVAGVEAAAGVLARDILDRIPAAFGKLRRGEVVLESITRLP